MGVIRDSLELFDLFINVPWWLKLGFLIWVGFGFLLLFLTYRETSRLHTVDLIEKAVMEQNANLTLSVGPGGFDQRGLVKTQELERLAALPLSALSQGIFDQINTVLVNAQRVRVGAPRGQGAMGPDDVTYARFEFREYFRPSVEKLLQSLNKEKQRLE